MDAISGTIEFYLPLIKPCEKCRTITNEETGLTYYALDGSDPLDPSNELSSLKYHDFPFVLNEDGSLWNHATLFLLSKIQMKVDITSDRLKQYADILRDFKKWCERTNIDYLKAERTWCRPNWMYRDYLVENNAKQLGNKMKKLSAFFDFLIKNQGIKYAVPLWKEEERAFFISNGRGGGFMKHYTHRDVDSEPKTQPQDDGYIRDGEKMRPMSPDEQRVFDATMLEHKNEELFLSTMIALNSGARKQTIFTLRLHHFIDTLPQSYDDYTISEWFNSFRSTSDIEEKTVHVGPGTGADTKGNKRFMLYIPGFLYKAIVLYIVSKRARSRRLEAMSQSREIDQYLFLSKASRPYYHSKEDINLLAYDKKEKGNTVNVMMKRFRDELYQKCVELKEPVFELRFHDFRATYAMNYLEANEKYIDSDMNWESVLKSLAKRLAHDDTGTTRRYLNYKQWLKYVPIRQNEWEEYRMEMINARTSLY